MRNRLAMDAPNEQFLAAANWRGWRFAVIRVAKRTPPLTYCQPMFTLDWLTRAVDAADCCPWGVAAGRQMNHDLTEAARRGGGRFTPRSSDADGTTRDGRSCRACSHLCNSRFS